MAKRNTILLVLLIVVAAANLVFIVRNTPQALLREQEQNSKQEFFDVPVAVEQPATVTVAVEQELEEKHEQQIEQIDQTHDQMLSLRGQEQNSEQASFDVPVAVEQPATVTVAVEQELEEKHEQQIEQTQDQTQDQTQNQTQDQTTTSSTQEQTTTTSTSTRTSTQPTVYVIPQVDKSGSSTLRRVFDRRGEFYNNTDSDHWTLFKYLRESKMCEKETRFTGKPYWPLVDLWKKYLKFNRNAWAPKHFWAVDIRLARASDTDCYQQVIKAAWEFWNKDIAVVDKKRYPLPVIQSPIPIPATKISLAGNGTEKTETIRVRRMMQMRDPLTWIEAHFGYFCKDCFDDGKFCGTDVDAKCGPKHVEKGDHETIQSWAQKFGNIFIRLLSGNQTLLKGGTWIYELVSPDGFTYPVQNHAAIVQQIVKSMKEEGHCYVALEDPHRMNKLEDCLGDAPDFYKDKLNITEHTQVNKRVKKKTSLDSNITAELQEILAPDIALYNALFPFLAEEEETEEGLATTTTSNSSRVLY